MQATIQTIIDTLIPSAKKLVLALIVLIAGLIILKWLKKRMIWAYNTSNKAVSADATEWK